MGNKKYPGRELNPYFRCGKLDFKSSASTSSATQVSGVSPKAKKKSTCQSQFDSRMEFNGAEDEARTRDLNLGKVALYQLSYFRIIKNREFVPYHAPHYPLVGLKNLFGTAKIGNLCLPKKFPYLYCGVYNVLGGTFTSGLPL